MPALLPVGDEGMGKGRQWPTGEADHGNPSSLMATAKVMKRGHISGPPIINAAAEIVKEASISAGYTRRLRKELRKREMDAKARNFFDAKTRRERRTRHPAGREGA